MNVSEQIINVLNNLCQKFGMAIDWSSANVLPYLKELCGRFINYEIYTSIAYMVLMLVLCVIPWVIFGATFKGAKNEDWDSSYFISCVNVLFGVIAIFMSLVAIVGISCQVFDIIEAIHLPEKTIYDYISCQINSVN